MIDQFMQIPVEFIGGPLDGKMMVVQSLTIQFPEIRSGRFTLIEAMRHATYKVVDKGWRFEAVFEGFSEWTEWEEE